MSERDFLVTALTPELCCTDFNQSLTFYTEVLGFAVQYQREEEGFAMLERQGSRLMIDRIAQNDKRSWITGALEHPFGRGVNLQMRTTDVDALYAHIKNANAPIFLPMEEKWYRCKNGYLGNRQFIAQDPDGYLLRFFEDLGERATLPATQV